MRRDDAAWGVATVAAVALCLSIAPLGVIAWASRRLSDGAH